MSIKIKRPAMWKMVKEAVTFYGGKASHDQVYDYIHKQWDDVKKRLLTEELIL